jgi:hypothetical protein
MKLQQRENLFLCIIFISDGIFGTSKNFNSSAIFEMKLVAYQHELKKLSAF